MYYILHLSEHVTCTEEEEKTRFPENLHLRGTFPEIRNLSRDQEPLFTLHL